MRSPLFSEGKNVRGEKGERERERERETEIKQMRDGGRRKGCEQSTPVPSTSFHTFPPLLQTQSESDENTGYRCEPLNAVSPDGSLYLLEESRSHVKMFT